MGNRDSGDGMTKWAIMLGARDKHISESTDDTDMGRTSILASLQMIRMSACDFYLIPPRLYRETIILVSLQRACVSHVCPPY